MKAKILFNLPEDQAELSLVLNASKMKEETIEFGQFLLNKLKLAKHDKIDEAELNLLIEIKDHFIKHLGEFL